MKSYLKLSLAGSVLLSLISCNGAGGSSNGQTNNAINADIKMTSASGTGDYVPRSSIILLNDTNRRVANIGMGTMIGIYNGSSVAVNAFIFDSSSTNPNIPPISVIVPPFINGGYTSVCEAYSFCYTELSVGSINDDMQILDYDTKYDVRLAGVDGTTFSPTYHFATQAKYQIIANNKVKMHGDTVLEADSPGGGTDEVNKEVRKTEDAVSLTTTTTTTPSKGIYQLDYLCNYATKDGALIGSGGDESHPLYKALVGSDGKNANQMRRICTDGMSRNTMMADDMEVNGLCGESNSNNWVLQPNSSYYNTKNELIQTSDPYAILQFSWWHGIYGVTGSTSDTVVLSGLNINWSIYIEKAFDPYGDDSHQGSGTCKAWTDYQHAEVEYGLNTKTTTDVIWRGDGECQTVYVTNCVEQPKAALVKPVYTYNVPLNQPIEIQFGYEVQADLIASSILLHNNTTGLNEPFNVDANTTSPDSNTLAQKDTNFILHPLNPLAAKTSYTVSINIGSGEQLVDGVGLPVPSQSFTFTTIQ